MNWAQPKETDLDTSKINEWIPPMEDIPEEFQRFKGSAWNEHFQVFFYRGVKGLEIIPVDGVDKAKAWAHIRVVMRSWEPKHEHKEAACAYLMSLWFKSIKYDDIKDSLVK